MKNFIVVNKIKGIASIFAILAGFFLAACVPNKVFNKAKLIEKSNISATIVIDAGHGGTDSGAVGALGLKEKDLTLDIARRVFRLLNLVMPNVQVIFTRDSDNYVGLEQRVDIANKAQADIFVSLHINSSETKNASGFEVYSLDIASDRHAERLAALENKSSNNGPLKFVLADLRANNNRAESDRLALLISQGLNAQLAKKVNKNLINDRGFRQAIFQVLFVKMPAVLTELFFISNIEEEKLLKSESVREMCARGLVVGMKAYLENKNAKLPK